jgi:hypothetical protein
MTLPIAMAAMNKAPPPISEPRNGLAVRRAVAIAAHKDTIIHWATGAEILIVSWIR